MENKEVIIEGWGPPEETDYDLRRRIQREQADAKRQERQRIKALKNAKVQQKLVDDLMKARMGKNWGRR